MTQAGEVKAQASRRQRLTQLQLAYGNALFAARGSGVVGFPQPRRLDPDTFGDPMRPLVWVSKSLEKLATALTSMGFAVGIDTVRRKLRKLGFSRQGNRKAEEGSNHADRDAQFQYINATVLAAQGFHFDVPGG